MKIWLADLTYTQQTISSDVVPAAVGMIAEYVAQELANHAHDVRVFKYPEDLSAALEEEIPDVFGVSNYVWNCNLSCTFASRIKEEHPETVVVMGGPNIPTVSSEQLSFLRERPWLDYYIVKEGELALVALLGALMEAKTSETIDISQVPNLLYLDDNGKLATSIKQERLTDLTAIPSPYISGRMDEFLDGRLLPVIQTNRGCPFSCTFCTEGQVYWNKVRRKSEDTIANELEVISSAMAKLPNQKRRNDLLIADSNFGMFKEDLDVCHMIAAEQSRADYPKYINVATGKNKKERVLEAAKIVNGAMKLAGSVQSLDPEVQKNIKRSNISGDQIVEMALKASEIGANTYSEVILALPGDSMKAHFKSLQALVEAQFNMISMYQLMILPGTELGLDSTKQQYGMTTRHRVLPRCFGTYNILGKDVSTAEIEEICVSNNSLPYEDYLQCRRMNLIINIFYNDSIFSGIIKYFQSRSISIWEWLYAIFSHSFSEDFDALCNSFLHETADELWDDYSDLFSSVSTPEYIEQLVNGELGNNLMFKYKALSITESLKCVCDVAIESAKEVLSSKSEASIEDAKIVEELILFRRLQIEGLFEDVRTMTGQFHYDIEAFYSPPAEDVWSLSRREAAQEIVFENSADQREMIESYTNLFGNDLPGLTRILSRLYLRQIMRHSNTCVAPN